MFSSSRPDSILDFPHSAAAANLEMVLGSEQKAGQPSVDGGGRMEQKFNISISDTATCPISGIW